MYVHCITTYILYTECKVGYQKTAVAYNNVCSTTNQTDIFGLLRSLM